MGQPILSTPHNIIYPKKSLLNIPKTFVYLQILHKLFSSRLASATIYFFEVELLYNYYLPKYFKNGIRVLSFFFFHKWPSSKKENNEHLPKTQWSSKEMMQKQTNENFFCTEKIIINRFSKKKFHLFFIRNFHHCAK